MITINDYPALTLDLQDIFVEGAKSKIASSVGLGVFKVADSMRKSYIHQVLHGIAGIQRVTGGQDLQRIGGEEGDQITWTQERFGAIAAVTGDMRMFDLYDEIIGQVKSLVEDAFDKVDQSYADVLTQGFNTSFTDVYGGTVSAIGPDGLALFHAAHTNPLTSRTFSNIITDGTTTNPTLSRAAIVHMRTVGKRYKDPNNLVRPINFDTLIVSAANEDLANRIVNSPNLPGSANNDVNPLVGKIKVIVWERLDTSGDATDKSAFWFMCDSAKVKETLQSKFAKRPNLDSPEVVYASKNWDYSCEFYYSIGRGFPAYIVGSNGTLS